MSTAASGGDPVWVRIHHPADLPALAEDRVSDALEDYGGFQWGRIPAAAAQRLQAKGLRVTVSENPFLMRLGGETFDPAERARSASPFPPRQVDPDGDYHVIQFRGPIRRPWLDELRTSGLEVIQPLHPFGYIVWATREQLEASSLNANIRWAGPMRSEWKVRPGFRHLDRQARPTMALASRHADPQWLGSELESIGQVHAISPLNAHFDLVHMTLPGSAYMQLAEISAIYAVQFIQQDAGPRGEMSNQSVVGNLDTDGNVLPGYATWLADTGHDGAGVIVGIVDAGILQSHQDLSDRMLPCLGDNPSCGDEASAHGTHVAGAVAGTGATAAIDSGNFLRGQGTAPGASLVEQLYPPFLGAGAGGMVPEGMLQIFEDSVRSGALLATNSWGPTTTPQGYDIPTMQVDMVSRDADRNTPGNQPLLAVWSIMNGNGDGTGACAPSSLGSPDEAKNLLAVGSTALQTGNGDQRSDIFDVSANSGHGPACDGRRVPHIVAPGCWTDSTDSSSDSAHAFNCGTSMASPVVAGAIAVWAENHIAETGGNPSPALAKAVITAAARDLEGQTNADGATMGHRPDRFQGFGRLDLDRVMNPGFRIFAFDQDLVFTETGQELHLQFAPDDPAEPVQIMLAWTDAPGHGLGGDTPAWVNNLDLVVESDGSTYLGNVIGTDGWSTSGGTADDRNNLEGVFLSPVQHSGMMFDATIAATDVTGDALNPWNSAGPPRQDFALACYNCQAEPTFFVSVDPRQATMCVPDSGDNTASGEVMVTSIGGYDGEVSLTATGAPGGVTVELDPETVTGTSTSLLTLTVDAGTPVGSHPLSISGDDGTVSSMSSLDLLLEEPLPAGPNLDSPTDGQMNAELIPVFSWNELAGVDDFRIQIASDSGFVDIVTDEVVTATTFTPDTELRSDAEHFWRVRGINHCGEGPWSDAFRLTTRVHPVAELSAVSLTFKLAPGGNGTRSLEIANTGTGDLLWEATTDQPGAGDGRDMHDPALDEVLALEPFVLPGGGTHDTAADAGIETRGRVVGFTFEGTVTGISDNKTFASDLAMRITGPDTTSYAVGGYESGNPAWEFDGAVSNEDGIYTSTHVGTGIFGPEGTLDEGLWQFNFEHTWQDEMSWSNVTVVLHKAQFEACADIQAAVDWLSVTPENGTVSAGESDSLQIDADSLSLAEGEYTAFLCLATNASDQELLIVPVTLEVSNRVFRDRFEPSD